MGRSVDIDALLGTEQLELTMKGKTYIVDDVPLELFLNLTNADQQDPEFMHKTLAKLLGVDIEEIRAIGFRAASMAIVEIHKWVMEVAAEGSRHVVELEELAAEPQNP